MTSKSRFIIFLIAVIFFSISHLSVFCQSVYVIGVGLPTAVITRLDGYKSSVRNIRFTYSLPHRNNIHDYFEIRKKDNLQNTKWIHLTQIKLAKFEKVEEDLIISVVLGNDEIISGIFKDQDMLVTGTSDLGYTKCKVTDIESMEFLKFDVDIDSGVLIDRELASEKYFNGVKNCSVSNWQIVDGDTIIKTTGFILLNSVSSYTLTIYKEDSRLLRSCLINNYFKVKRGPEENEIFLHKFEKIEITGNEVDGSPEMILAEKDGKSFKVVLTPGGKGNTFEPDDMLIWNTSYGYEGRSLVPLRKITIQRIK